MTENLSAAELASMGFSAVAYPWTLVAAHLKSIRETLENLKASMTVGAPPMILSYDEVCSGVGFPRYWVRLFSLSLSLSLSLHEVASTDKKLYQDLEQRYKYDDQGDSSKKNTSG